MCILKNDKLTKQALSDYFDKHYTEKAKKIIKGTLFESLNGLKNQFITELYDLNNAILNDYEVWFTCEKEPRNLDSGRHYYQIWFLAMNNGKPIRRHFWVLVLMDNTGNRSGYRWNYTSGATGMSRLIDATDHVFNILKACGGCYVQLS